MYLMLTIFPFIGSAIGLACAAFAIFSLTVAAAVTAGRATISLIDREIAKDLDT